MRGMEKLWATDRRLKGWGFDPETLVYMGVRSVRSPQDACKVMEYVKRVGIVPKEAELEAYAYLLSQDLVCFRFAHWTYPKVHGGDMVSLEYMSLVDLKDLESKAKHLPNERL